MRDLHDFGLDTAAADADRSQFLHDRLGSESRNVLRNGHDVVGLTANSTGFDERHGTFSPGDSGIIGAFTEPSSEKAALKSRETDTGHSTNTLDIPSNQSVARLSCPETKREPTVNFLTKEVARIVRAALPRRLFPTQQQLVAAFDYDPLTGVFRWKARTSPRWRQKIGDTAGSKDAQGYIQIKFLGTSYKAHHLAWIYVHGEMHDMPQTDHKDGDRSNNAIANLRPCYGVQNQANQRVRNLSGLPKGVRRTNRGKPFAARIRFQKRLIHIGTFDTAEEAARAYFEVAQKLWGEFARQDGVGQP